MKTALIWGAGGGIGQAIARQLAKENWFILAAGRNLEACSNLTEHTFDIDLNNTFSVESAITRISQVVNEVDLWVYAAGDIASLRVSEMSPLEWQRIIQANLSGAYLATHYSWPLLAEGAHLFYLGAISERMHLPGLAAYAAAKAGLEAFADVVRKESRRKVTVLRPAAVDTPFWSKVPFRLPPHHQKADELAARLIQAYADGSQGQIDF